MISRKVFSLLTGFVMVLTMIPYTAFAADGESVSYVDRDWDEASKTVVEKLETCTGYTELTDDKELIDLGAAGDVTWYVVKGNIAWESNYDWSALGRDTESEYYCRRVYGDVHIILCDGASIDFGDYGIEVQEGSSITIYGQEGDSGVIKSSSSGSGTYNRHPAIGLKDGTGAITIDGGIINAQTETRAAAIGSCMYGQDGGTVTINGGTVTAESGSRGAAIGGGSFEDTKSQYGCQVVINGGEVVAKSEGYGAAIGGAIYGGGNVVINGGKVTANATGYGTAIGGGYLAQDGEPTSVTINGGQVSATSSGGGGAGIGGSYLSKATEKGKITITGGTVTATGAGNSAGIGDGGSMSAGMDIEITGGNVKAEGNAEIGGTIDVVKNEIELIGLREPAQVTKITGEGVTDYKLHDVNVIEEDENTTKGAKLYAYFAEGRVADTVTVKTNDETEVTYYRDAVGRYYDHVHGDWSYAVTDDDRLAATCGNMTWKCECGTVGLQAPAEAEAVYTGEAIEATIDMDEYFTALIYKAANASVDAVYSGIDENGKTTPLNTGEYPTDAGKYKAELKLEEDTYSNCSVTYDITPKSISGATIDFGDLTADDFVFNGSDRLPEIIVKDGDKELVQDRDYTITYKADGSDAEIDTAINAGAYLVVVTGIGNYKDSENIDFEIAQATNSWIEAPSAKGWTFGDDSTDKIDRGEPKFGNADAVTVQYTGTDIDGEAYGASDALPTYAGEYTALFSVAENDNYTGLTATEAFKISPRKNEDGTYSGKEDNIYIPVDTDGDGTEDKFVEVEKDDNGVYKDDANGDGTFGGDGDKGYVPIDKDDDGEIDYYVPEDTFEDKKDDYSPVDDDNDGDIDRYVPEDEFKEEDYVAVDDDDDGETDRYVPTDEINKDITGEGGHVHQEKKPASCTEGALCATCNEYYGNALDHVWGLWKKVNGTKHIRTCTRDGCDHAEMESHSEPLTCGLSAGTCDKCGATGASSCEVDTENWMSDSNKHWHECTKCGARQDEAAHDYNEDVDPDIPQTCPVCEYGGHITRVNSTGLTDQDIPQTLKGIYKTANAIQNAMEKELGNENANADGSVLYDAVLEYSVDGGTSWYRASEAYFPDDGRLYVKLEVPKGTSIDTHNYTVLHMFSSGAFGNKAGDIEAPKASKEKGADGKEYITFYVKGLSPIMVAWESINSTALGGGGGASTNEGGEIPIDDNSDGEIDRYITEDELDKDKDKYVPIDKDGDGDIDYYTPKDSFNEDDFVPVDEDNDGDIDYYTPKDSFNEDDFVPVDKDNNGDIDYYIPNGVLTDPDGDGIYTPDGKDGMQYEGVDRDGDGIADVYVLPEGDGAGTGDDSNMLVWLLVMMTALTAAAIIVLGSRYRRN